MMSSAALQTAPHQSPALSSSSRQYTPSQSSPTRETYNAHSSAAASPSSRRPPSRKRSDNTAAALGASDIPASVPARSSAAASYSQPHQPSPLGDRAANMAPPAPPRTSSSYQNGSSRKSSYVADKMASSPREAPRAEYHGDTNGSYDAHKSRRPGATSFPLQQDSPARQTNSRDGRKMDTSMPIRTNPADTSRQQPRQADAGETLGRIITNPEEANYHDSQLRESEPSSGSPEERRGERRRQEHSRSHKTSKFGDFILGNTIGEGEFGKVKLGWKQDSSVQVRTPSLQGRLHPYILIQAPLRLLLNL